MRKPSHPLYPWVFATLMVYVCRMSRAITVDMFVSAPNVRTIYRAESEEHESFVGANFSALPLGVLIAVQALDFHPEEETIYWTDHGYAQIFRSKVDGSEKKAIVPSGLAAPIGLSLDLVRGRLYWVDASLESIESANLDGSDRTVLIDEGLYRPQDLVISSVHRIMFWPNLGDITIRKAFIDGRNQSIVINTDVRSPTGVAVNKDETRLYWCDYELGRVESVDFDGGNRKIHVDGVVGFDIRPWRVAVDGDDDDIYFTDNVNQVVIGPDSSGEMVPITSRGFFNPPWDICVRTNDDHSGIPGNIDDVTSTAPPLDDPSYNSIPTTTITIVILVVVILLMGILFLLIRCRGKGLAFKQRSHLSPKRVGNTNDADYASLENLHRDNHYQSLIRNWQRSSVAANVTNSYKVGPLRRSTDNLSQKESEYTDIPDNEELAAKPNQPQPNLKGRFAYVNDGLKLVTPGKERPVQLRRDFVDDEYLTPNAKAVTNDYENISS